MFQATHVANPVRVNAARILEWAELPSGNLMLRLSDGRNYEADTSMTVRYAPSAGDYLVTQEDGYEYLNPKDVFERKYSLLGQAKTVEDREHDTKQMAIAADRADDARRYRAQVLELALRTPGLSSHRDVLAAAGAYQAHIDGEQTAPASQPLAERPALGAAFPGYSTMPPHQQRVVDEKAELDARLAKLIPFFDTPIFAGLDEGEKGRLERQEEAMKAYSAILTERIAAFTAANSTAV